MRITFYNCRFTYRFISKIAQLKMKIQKEKNLMRRESLTGTMSLLSCLNHLRRSSLTSLRPGFRNRFTFHQFRQNALIILVLFFQIIWTFPNMEAFFRCLSCYSNYPSTLKSFISFVTLGTLSRYQSPSNYRKRREQHYAQSE